MVGKADVFATGGPMRRIADKLVTGLTQVKKTQFTWDLAAKRMKEAGGELTPDMVKDIEQNKCVISKLDLEKCNKLYRKY